MSSWWKYDSCEDRNQEKLIVSTSCDPLSNYPPLIFINSIISFLTCLVAHVLSPFYHYHHHYRHYQPAFHSRTWVAPRRSHEFFSFNFCLVLLIFDFSVDSLSLLISSQCLSAFPPQPFHICFFFFHLLHSLCSCLSLFFIPTVVFPWFLLHLLLCSFIDV